MTFTDQLFIIWSFAAVALSWGSSRSLAWVGVIALNYFTCGLYWRLGAPAPVVFTGVTDFAMLVLVFIFARYLWEAWLFVLYQVSLLAGVVYLIMGTGDDFYLPYSLTLEAVTTAALWLIGGTSAWQRAGINDVAAFKPWRTVLGFPRPILGAATAYRPWKK